MAEPIDVGPVSTGGFCTPISNHSKHLKLVTLHEQQQSLYSVHHYNHGEFLLCEEKVRKPAFLGFTSGVGSVLALLTITTIPMAAKTVQWAPVSSWRQMCHILLP